MSNMSNATKSASGPGCVVDSEAVATLKAVVYSLIIIISLLGNTIVMVAIHRDTIANRTITLYITNICAADLVITLVYLPRMVARHALHSTRWVGGTVGAILCKLVPYVYHVSVTASILTLLALAIDRFLAVFYPLKRRSTRSKTRHGKIALFIIWLVAFLARSPYFSVLTLKEKSDSRFICSSSFKNRFSNHLFVRQLYYTLLLVVFYAIPLFVTCFLYLAIIIHLRMRQTTTAARQNISASRSGFNFQKASKKTVYTFIGISIAFTLCWGLYFFAQVVFSSVPCELRFWRAFLANINCVINPCVFLALNPQHRRLLQPSKVMATRGFSSRSRVAPERPMQPRDAITQL